MSDEELQRLRRSWAQSGTREDAAAYLRASVSAGAMSQAQLELAGYLGYRPALDVLGQPDPWGEPIGTSESYLGRQCTWFEGLERFGAGTCARAALAVARACKAPAGVPFQPVVDAYEAWLEEPGPAAQERCAACLRALKPTREAPSMGLFNPTGTSDDDVVDDAMRQWERAHGGVRIWDLALHESAYTSAEALVKLTGADDQVRAASWFFNVQACQSPRLERQSDAIEAVQQGLLAWLGLGERFPADDLAHPCPYVRPGERRPGERGAGDGQRPAPPAGAAGPSLWGRLRRALLGG